MRQLICCTLLCIGFLIPSFAQVDSYKPADLVEQAKTEKSPTIVSPFAIDDSRSVKVPDDLINYELLSVDISRLTEVIESTNDFFELSIPQSNRSDLRLELVQVEVTSGNGYVIEKPSNRLAKVNPGKHFRGIIKGNKRSLVAISVFDNEVMGFISQTGKSNLVIGKLKNESTHIVYEDVDLKEKFGFECATPDKDIEYSIESLEGHGLDSRALSDCVRIYFEVDYDIYTDKGSSITQTTNYITGLFNQVATMYANEQINITLSPLNIWTQPSPYNSSTSSGMLNAFLANTGSFDGDLAQLLSYKASGGIAYVDQLCSSNPDLRKSFSSIDPTYQNVPVYSWSVMVVTHEFGHLFGSSHTHACAWNGNNTAIDGCYTTEGSCPQPGIPSQGGTVMSYCHLTSVGINLNEGFGPQPGNLIRSRVTNASCLDPCGGGGPTCSDGIQNGNETGVDCGGPDCPACPQNCNDTEAVLTIILDNYPGETTWTLTNSSGTTLYSGGPYSGAGSTVSETFCLVDGCYDFTINDSYGDGICCGYGQGSYDISIGGQSVANGGQFGSQEVKNFCVGNSGPTCDDGIQNGNETGVDCGGPDCPPCGGGNDELFLHYFETGWDGWQDGGSDCYRYSGPRSYEGSYSIRIRDNSGTASAMTSPTYNLTQYTGVEVTFFFYPNSMETGEDFWLRYYNGSSWQTVATFVSGTSFQNNTFYTATVPILSSSYNMASNARFRFQCDASANADRIYIDQVSAVGLGAGSTTDGEIKIRALHSLADLDEFGMLEEIQISPNPAKDEIRVKMNSDDDQGVSIKVVDMLGRTVINTTINLSEGSNVIPVDITTLESGTYFMKVTDSDGDEMIDKFIKLH